jgi:diadenylate cyclase
MEVLKLMLGTIRNISLFSILDIIVVAFIFYKLYMLIKETRAEQLLKGIVLIFILIPISHFSNLTMLNWILNKTITIGVLTIVIIFQPEIRRALEHIGSTAFTDKHMFENEEVMEKIITEIVNAVENLSKSKTGALIVIEQKTGIGEIIKTGTTMDAVISTALLENIFVVNTPLHDGATVIRNNRIIAAGCFLPLTDSDRVSKKLGTRHRAAIGITESSDALTIIVSEETGTISLAVNGRLVRNYDRDKLKKVLVQIIKNRQSKKITFKERIKSWIKTENNNL